MIGIFAKPDPSHPRNWSKQCAFRDRNTELPKGAGVYAVMNARGQILYIGKSESLHRRWRGKAHGRYPQASRVFGCRLHWEQMRQSQIHVYERELIRRFDPSWNNTPLPERSRWGRFFTLEGAGGGGVVPAFRAIVALAIVFVSLFELLSNREILIIAICLMLPGLFSITGKGSGKSLKQAFHENFGKHPRKKYGHPAGATAATGGEPVTPQMLGNNFTTLAQEEGTSAALRVIAGALREITVDYDNQEVLLECVSTLEATTELIED